jgi:hypothetical protein
MQTAGVPATTAMRGSTTELRSEIAAAGIEPTTTRVTGEVSVVYATGQNCCFTGEWLKKFRERFACGTLCFGTTPPSRRRQLRQGSLSLRYVCRK